MLKPIPCTTAGAGHARVHLPENHALGLGTGIPSGPFSRRGERFDQNVHLRNPGPATAGTIRDYYNPRG